jgi:hypothetical protein
MGQASIALDRSIYLHPEAFLGRLYTEVRVRVTMWRAKLTLFAYSHCNLLIVHIICGEAFYSVGYCGNTGQARLITPRKQQKRLRRVMLPSCH